MGTRDTSYPKMKPKSLSSNYSSAMGLGFVVYVPTEALPYRVMPIVGVRFGVQRARFIACALEPKTQALNCVTQKGTSAGTDGCVPMRQGCGRPVHCRPVLIQIGVHKGPWIPRSLHRSYRPKFHKLYSPWRPIRGRDPCNVGLRLRLGPGPSEPFHRQKSPAALLA